MNKLIIAVLAVSGAAIVYAQAETDDRQGRHSEFRAEMRALIDGNGMNVEDLANLMQARATTRFEAIDTDGDGIISKDDFLASATERAENRFERMNPDDDGIVKRTGRDGWGKHREGGPRAHRGEEKPNLNPERRAERIAGEFARLDTDGDGIITREEFEAGMAARGERSAERREQRAERREQRHERREQRRADIPDEIREMHGQLRALMRDGMNLESFTGLMRKQASARFDALDTDGNGELTAAEFTAGVGERAQQVFARMDRNDDGIVTSDDRPRGGGWRNGPRP